MKFKPHLCDDLCEADDDEEKEEATRRNNISQVENFYRGQTVFITGATGFLGTLLVEKLLRCCPEIRKLILLVRSTKSKSVEERVKDYFSDEVFDKMRQANFDYYKKVDIVCGQLDSDNLGLTPRDAQILISQTTIIFHIAATVRFDDHMRTAYNINVKGTDTLISMAKCMKQLKSFVYVSTAYCNCDHKYIEEVFYPPSFTSEQLSSLISWTSDEEIAILNQHIVGAKPNTYTLTKATAEHLVQQASDMLPICVFRPSIVMPTLEEPLPLWIKGFNGILAFTLTVGIGLLRVMLNNNEHSVDIVPADRTINAMTTLAWYQTTQRPGNEDRVVFNYVSYNDNRVLWGEYSEETQTSTLASEETCEDVLWKPNVTSVSHVTLFCILFYICHLVPAIVFTLAEKLMHRKPRVLSTYRKIFFLIKLVEKFSLTEFGFSNENTRSMVAAMSEDEKVFDSSMSNFAWSPMFLHLNRTVALYTLGKRLTKQNYQSRMKYIYKVDDYLRLIVKTIVVYLSLNFLAKLINLFILQ